MSAGAWRTHRRILFCQPPIPDTKLPIQPIQCSVLDRPDIWENGKMKNWASDRVENNDFFFKTSYDFAITIETLKDNHFYLKPFTLPPTFHYLGLRNDSLTLSDYERMITHL
jgi:hypothetical protein